MRKEIRLGELFCGAGGFALGAYHARFQDYRFKHVWGLDNDRFACETFKNRFKETQVFCEHIEDFDFTKPPKIDGILFGFPCNDFSNVGKKKGTRGRYGGLYIHCVEALRILSPIFFVAENVGGLRGSNGGSDYDIILNSFKDSGYLVSGKYYKLEQYGIPQRRHRLFLVGFRKELGIQFEHLSPPMNFVSARKALSDIPDETPNHDFTKQSDVVMERLSHIKEGENAFTAELPPHLKLHVKGAKMSMIYRRLVADHPSYTITGSGGGGTHVYHWEQPRALTNRERARLQTFPDDFVFCGSRGQVRRQIGMAVPPKAGQMLFHKILETIDSNKDAIDAMLKKDDC